MRKVHPFKTAQLLERISYSIESALYNGADVGDACDNEDGKETSDQGVFDGGDSSLIVQQTQNKFWHWWSRVVGGLAQIATVGFGRPTKAWH